MIQAHDDAITNRATEMISRRAALIGSALGLTGILETRRAVAQDGTPSAGADPDPRNRPLQGPRISLCAAL